MFNKGTVLLPYNRFYHEYFNIALGSICNIKIRVIFVKRNILWQVSHNNTSIILQAIVY